jgi:ElaB/YqjD/DUF883 family membrane-anchored ribosome-binding protein
MSEQTKTSGEDIQALKEDLKQLREDLADLAGAFRSEGGEKIGEIRDRMQERARRAGETVSQGAGEVKHAAEEHPFTTAAIALCVGLLTGALLRGGKS